MTMHGRLVYVLVTACLGLIMMAGGYALAASAPAGKWMTGDFHNHSWTSDGFDTEAEVIHQAFDTYKLDWMANADHGGQFANSPAGIEWGSLKPAPTILGNPWGGHMWRWQSLRDYQFPLIELMRGQYKTKALWQGFEWDVPSHEHASLGIVGEDENKCKSIATFEYLFDEIDTGTAGDDYLGTHDKTPSTTHQKALDGIAWLHANYPNSSYVVINHPSRQLKNSISDLRDFNNAGPDVCIGMEGFPGHQPSPKRGDYDKNYGDNTYKARTYGGADYMTAKVGGVWDALLGEGRHFWIFIDSDYHSHQPDVDFYPGEYGKTHVYVKDTKGDGFGPDDVVTGMRAGGCYTVEGDLISDLGFRVKSSSGESVMGETCVIGKDEAVTVTVRVKSPETNNSGKPAKLDHIDLIMGDVTGYAKPGSPAYSQDTNPSTHVITTFNEKNWKTLPDGFKQMTFKIDHVKGNAYLRLRGSSVPPNTPNETDELGNPLNDDLMGTNTAEKAYADLWFYSNPIFIRVK